LVGCIIKKNLVTEGEQLLSISDTCLHIANIGLFKSLSMLQQYIIYLYL